MCRERHARSLGVCPSGQRRRAVNPLAYAYDGSNPSAPIDAVAVIPQSFFPLATCAPDGEPSGNAIPGHFALFCSACAARCMSPPSVIQLCSAYDRRRVRGLLAQTSPRGQHHGLHAFCAHAAKLRTLVEVRDAAGHSNIATTSIYLHIVADDDGEVSGMFAFVR